MYDRQLSGAQGLPVRVRVPLVSREPTLQDMLSDPIILDRISADGLQISAVKQVVIDAIERNRS